MPDIQAGEVEITKEEASFIQQHKDLVENQKGVYDENGEFHDESKFNHLGRS